MNMKKKIIIMSSSIILAIVSAIATILIVYLGKLKSNNNNNFTIGVGQVDGSANGEEDKTLDEGKNKEMMGEYGSDADGEECKPLDEEKNKETAGLDYVFNASGGHYICWGLGIATGNDIVIPSTHNDRPVKEIKAGAFSGCLSLTSITIPNSVENIGENAFSGCSSLTSITIPDNVKEIGFGVFSDCSSLTSINMPDSLENIGENAFSGCSSLTNMIIPDGVKEIGDGAFSDCSSLTSVTMPDSLENIGENTFWGCSSLTNIFVDKSNLNYCSIDGSLYNADKTTLIQYAVGKQDANFTIPNSVTNIGKFAFSGCSSLTSINILDSVKKISDSAFFGCSSLTSMNIPDSVDEIGFGAFNGCSSLTSMAIPFVGLSKRAIYGQLGEKGTNFGYIFGVAPYEGGTQTEASFAGETVDGYYIPTTLTSVTVTTAIEWEGLGFKTMPISAFGGCVTLREIILPEDLGIIPESAFYGCYNLNSIEIPEGVYKISAYAFRQCYSLTSITIPESVGKIDTEAFYNCNALIEVWNKSNALNITKGNSNNGWVGKYALNVYKDEGDKKTFIDDNGYKFYVDGETRYLVGYIGNETELTLPASCNGQNYAIYEYAFYGNLTLTSVTIPDSVTGSLRNVFRGCSSLTTVTIGEGIEGISPSTFGESPALTTINYNGTKAQWNDIWGTYYSLPSTWTVKCADGDITNADA